MSRAPYATNLTDREWAVIGPLLPPARPGGRPRTSDLRVILDAIFYVLRSGCPWRLLPRDLPPWPTVYDYFRKWRLAGEWDQLNTALREQVRMRAGRQPTPSGAIIDSQSVKTTERGGPHGYDGAKKLSGRKRHLLVDTTGLLLKVVVHPANLQDREGARLVLAGLNEPFPRIQRLWADQGYAGQVTTWIQQTLGWAVTIVRHRPTSRGRWVVERTIGWIGRNRRLSKDYEFRLATSEAWVYLSMIRVMLRRLAYEQVEPAFHYRRVA